MDMRPSALLRRVRSTEGQKMFRYTMVSVISVIVGQAILFVTFGLLHPVLHWTAKTCNIVAVTVSGVPSYYLNRAWAWGKTGKSHLWREVVPFWTLAFIGLALSTWAVDFARSNVHGSHLKVAVSVNAASSGAFGILWIGKFILFNKVMFVHHPEDLPEALDGRTGIPT
jgi:putative flippase GtrA